MSQPIIFTDLDGTLLDHHSYRFDAALPLLKYLDKHNIKVIPNTSKTASELLFLRQKIGLTGPFIVENGAAIYIPTNELPAPPKNAKKVGEFWVINLTAERHHWQHALATTSSKFGACYTPMSAISTAEFASYTGLDIDSARRAAERGFGEPLIWKGNDAQKAEFIAELEAQGAGVLEGGRFMHVSGPCDKGKALTQLTQIYSTAFQDQFISYALGDGNNDIAMLDAADFAAVIRSPVHDAPKLQRQHNVEYSQATGPEGWTEVLTHMLSISHQLINEV